MLILITVLLPFFGAVLSVTCGRGDEKRRDLIVLLVVLADFLLTCALLFMGGASLYVPGVLPGGLSFRIDGFRSVYALIASFMWLFTTIFSREYFLHEKENLGRYLFFLLMTMGATEGVMLSGDLMTAFLFFEILSFTSFTWVIHEETKEAVRAGYTYLFIAVIGGLILFMGLVLLKNSCGTLAFSDLAEAVRENGVTEEVFAAGICILLGFGAKAGMFPLHIWLPKAHPVAPSPGSALLSGILTKVGIYGILMTTLSVFVNVPEFGALVLILGEITMFLGALLALFSVNLKRTLACSSMSQIGFILTGTGMHVLLVSAGEEEGALLSLSGVMLHMVNHSLIKLTLFMCAGVVVMRLGVLTLDEIRGFGRRRHFLKAAFLFGALGISGVPLFDGYISKTLLHEGIVEGIHAMHEFAVPLKAAEWVFLVSGGFTFAYMLKLFIAVFVERNRDAARQEAFDRDPYTMNRASTAVVFGSSLLMAVLGQPYVMTHLAAFMTGNREILHFRAFTLTNLKGGFISLSIGGLLYLFFVRAVLLRRGSYVNLWPGRLDLENLVYRPLLTRILPGIFGAAAAVFGENRVLKPLCRFALSGIGSFVQVFGENRVLRPFCRSAFSGFGALLQVFGENRILAPVSRFVMFMAVFIGRVLTVSTDALAAFFRRTAARERRVTAPKEAEPGLMLTLRAGTDAAVKSLSSNFSFALMMTCIGILLILGGLVLLLAV